MMHFNLATIVLLGLLLTACSASQPATSPNATAAAVLPAQIGVAELKTHLDAGTPLLLLDVRSQAEFDQDGHIAGATLIPLPELEQRLSELPKDKPIACICRSGNRSRTACNLLVQHGFNTVTDVQGGMQSWIKAGFATE